MPAATGTSLMFNTKLYSMHYKVTEKKRGDSLFPRVLRKKMVLVMRLTCFLLCWLTFSAVASVNAQQGKVSIDIKSESLSRVLMQVKDQTGARILYNENLLRDVECRDLKLEGVDVEEALRQILAPTPFDYTVSEGVVVIRQRAAAPQAGITIRGKVTDKRKQPIPGATVIIQGTTLGTTTVEDGTFVLEIPEREDITLLFSFIGMKSVAVRYTGQESLQVVLEEEATEIDEVVVTGYQTIDRRKNTSAVTSVKAEDIMIPGVMTIDKMLEGQIPDLMVMTNSGESGVAPRIRIRGTSTLIGNREPLWVVDGVIVQDPVQISPDELNDPDYINRIGNAISGLNPQDIERIDVLKDASATALYGTKAANGVIVITTKRGHIGEPEISYRGTVSMKLRPRYTDRNIDVMSAEERLNVSRELAEGHYEYNSNVTWVGYEALLRQLYNRAITYEEFETQVAELGEMNTDWFKLLTHDAFSSSHSLSVTGGTEKVRYYSSLGVNLENDVIDPNNEKRYTGTLNLDMNLTPWLSASFNLNANTSKKEMYQTDIAPIDYAYNTSRAIPAYTEDGEYSYYTKNGGSVATSYRYNILNELENSSMKQNISAATFRVNLDVRPVDWIKVRGILSYSFNNTNIESYWGEKSHYAAQLRYGEYGGIVDAEESLLPYGGELTKQDIRSISYMFRLQADVNKYWGVDMQHNINASVGMEVNSTKYDAFETVSRGYSPERGKQFITITPGNYPAFDTWLSSNVPVVTDNLTNMLSWYGSVSYSYGNWFTVNANMRYDGSNQFGERSNENILPIWSASFNYNIIEHFRDKQNVFDNLMLKLSYGYQGNMLDDQSPVMVIAKEPMDEHYGEYVSTIDIYPNPYLTWEKTGSLNLGLEFSMLKSRVMLSASYYHKKTKDAYMEKEISGVNGMESYVVNGGEIKNSGYDFSLTVNPIRRDDLRWYISTSFSHTNNEVNSTPGVDQYEREDFLNGTAIVNGQSVSSFYSYKFIGLDPATGLPLFDDGEDIQEQLYGASKYDVFTKVLENSGSREPKIYGGLNTTVNYKRWRLNAAFSYSLGAKTRLFKLYADDYGRIRPENNLNRAFLNRWQYPGDEKYTSIPVFIAAGGSDSYLYHWSGFTDGMVPEIASTGWEEYNYSNIRVVSANYLKCTNIALTYNIKAERLGCSLLEVQASVSNPFVWSSKELQGQTPVQSGFTEIQLSERPTFTLGLNVTF